jgi:hypothetical protein
MAIERRNLQEGYFFSGKEQQRVVPDQTVQATTESASALEMGMLGSVPNSKDLKLEKSARCLALEHTSTLIGCTREHVQLSSHTAKT